MSVARRRLEHRAAGPQDQAESVVEIPVEHEDDATGIRLQWASRSGRKAVTQFGRNEGGGRRFHSFVGDVPATADEDLAGLFDGARG